MNINLEELEFFLLERLHEQADKPTKLEDDIRNALDDFVGGIRATSEIQHPFGNAFKGVRK